MFGAEELDCFLTYELMAGTVETVFSDFVLLVDAVRNAVHERLGRHCAVESRIEHGDHRYSGHNFHTALYARDVAGHMERSEFRVLFADADDFVVDYDGSLEVFAAVQNTVSDRADFGYGRNCAGFFVDECFEHEFDCLFMGGHIGLQFEFSAVRRFLRNGTALHGNAFTNTFEQRFFGDRVDELIFKRRTACVDDENVHTALT